jgi:cardiolipin synthase (CMP-forming)
MQIPASLRSLPNQLTVARILAIPVICLMLVIGWDWLRWLALIIYVAAAITDWLDGFLARRMGESSDLGKMLDPIADKLLVGALLIVFAWTRDFSSWELIPAIAILMREIFIAGLREYLGNKAVSVPVTFLAKWKTTAQLVALFFVIVDGLLPSFTLISAGLLWLAAILTVWTGWQYLRSTWVHFDSPVSRPPDVP